MSFSQLFSYFRQIDITDGAARVSDKAQSAYGTLDIHELANTITTATTYTRYFPGGLRGVEINHAVLDVTNTAVRRYFVAFSNTAFNDVTVAELRHTIPAVHGDQGKVFFNFTNEPYPTSMTIVADVAETGAGDSLALVKTVEG